VVSVEGIMLPSDSVLLSFPTIAGLTEEVRDPATGPAATSVAIVYNGYLTLR
jgi:hypothetical protein